MEKKRERNFEHIKNTLDTIEFKHQYFMAEFSHVEVRIEFSLAVNERNHNDVLATGLLTMREEKEGEKEYMKVIVNSLFHSDNDSPDLSMEDLSEGDTSKICSTIMNEISFVVSLITSRSEHEPVILPNPFL